MRRTTDVGHTAAAGGPDGHSPLGPGGGDLSTTASADDGAGASPVVVLDGPARPARRSWRGPLIAYGLTVFLLLTFNFALPRALPGDPISALMVRSSPDYVESDVTREKLTEYYNLGESIPTQYAHYLGALARGDLGTSIYFNTPVTELIWARLKWSFLLVGTSMVLAIVIGMPTGIHSGWRRGRRVDRGLLGFFMGVENLPVFFVGALALLVFSAKLGWFPLGGATTPFADYGLLRQILDVAHHAALPAVLMALEFAAVQYLVMRGGMVSELGADYLTMGRAKGLRDRKLKYGYAGRNALLPVVTVVGMQFSLAIASSIFIERLFAYPGLGLFMFDSVGVRDYPAMQGSFLVMSIAVVTVNFGVEMLYTRLDPRAGR